MTEDLVPERIGVLIVADVRLYREGLAASLASRPRLTVTATSASREDARDLVRVLHPDVVVLDMAIRESLDLIHDLQEEAVRPKILAFAVEEVAWEILDCAEAGASGYVTADASIEDLVSAIERIARHELVCSAKIAATLFSRVAERTHRRMTDRSPVKSMTNRESEVLECIRQGQSNKEIAQKLNIAEPTVKNHVHHLLEKLEVSTRAQAAARATMAFARQRPFGMRRVL